MAELHIFTATPTSIKSDTRLIVNNLFDNAMVQISPPSEKDVDTLDDCESTCKIVAAAAASDHCEPTEEITEQQPRVETQTVTSVDGSEVMCSTCKLGRTGESNVSDTENKENAAVLDVMVAESK